MDASDSIGNRAPAARLARRSGAWQHWLLASLAALACVLPLRAQAQDDLQRKAAAEALFQEGLKLRSAHDNEGACRRFEQSQALDSGVGILLYLGECYELQGRTASAWVMFHEAESAARAAGQVDRARIAHDRADRLEPKLARLTVDVAALEPREGLALTINGKPLDPALIGVGFPIDPGRYELVARARGRKDWTGSVQVQVAQQLTLQVPLLESQPQNAGLSGAVVSSAVVQNPAPQGASSLPGADPYGSSTADTGAALTDAGTPFVLTPRQRAAVFVAAGGGVALLTGAALGIVANGKDNAAEDAGCEDKCPTQHGADLNEQARNWALGANIAYVVGGLAVATGIGLYLLPEKTSASASNSPLGVSAQVGPRGALLTVGGAL